MAGYMKSIKNLARWLGLKSGLVVKLDYKHHARFFHLYFSINLHISQVLSPGSVIRSIVGVKLAGAFRSML